MLRVGSNEPSGTSFLNFHLFGSFAKPFARQLYPFGGRVRVLRSNPLLMAPVTLAFSAYNIGTFAVTNTARWRTCGRP
jgi:hypothetical protein